MHRIILTMVTGMLAVSATSQANELWRGGPPDVPDAVVTSPGRVVGCDPGPDQVSFYEHRDYGGRCFQSTEGFVPVLGTGGRDWAGVSSVKVGSNMQVVLCSGERFKGACTLAANNISYLGNVEVGNDRLVSFYVRKPVACSPRGNQAAVFSGVAFSGECVTLDQGEYPDNSRFDFANGIASVLQLPPREGGGVRLCTRNNYKGQCETILVAADASLQDNQPGVWKTASIKVLPPLPECSGTVLPLQPNALPVQFVQASASYENCDGYDSVVLEIRQNKGWWFDETLDEAALPEDGQALAPSGTLGVTYQCKSGTYDIKLFAKLRAVKGRKSRDLGKSANLVVTCGVPQF